MKLNAALLFLCFSLFSCGSENSPSNITADLVADAEEEDCPNCTEEELNAPIEGTEYLAESEPEEDLESAVDAFSAVAAKTKYKFPAFKAEWKLSQAKYNKARRFYETSNIIKNRRYVVIIDFSKKSTEKRLYLFDLAEGTVTRHMAAHGKGSDRNGDGIAERFSNTNQSKASSLGFYVTKGTYIGKHGKSLVLKGLSKTNSNAEKRKVVFHAARYMNEKARIAGRSWGCPAMDPKVYFPVMNKIKGGSLVMMDN